ncbi:hypothetical protein ACVWYU_001399 [Pseudomonas sp. TE12234]
MSNKNLEQDKEAPTVAVDQSLNVEGFKFGDFGQSRSSPVILTPDNFSIHPVGTHVLLSGTCQENAKIEVFNGQEKFGDAVVVGTRWFCYRIWGVASPGDGLNGDYWFGWRGNGAGAMLFYVEQTLDDGSRQQSEMRLFTVGYLQQSPRPVINAPVHGSEFTGGEVGVLGSCAEGATIDLAMNGEWDVYVATESNGRFFRKRFPAPGSVTFVAKQTVPGYLRSAPSDSVTVNVLALNDEVETSSPIKDSTIDSSASTRKPPAPTINSPVAGSSFFPLQRFLLSGTCEEGAGILLDRGDRVWVESGRVIGKAWYAGASPTGVSSLGTFSFKVKQIVNGAHSDYSDEVSVLVEFSPPLIIFPKSGATHSVGDLFVSGVCDNDATVAVFNASTNQLLGYAVVTGKTWVFFHEWSKGLHRLVVKQTYWGYTSRESEQISFTVQ